MIFIFLIKLENIKKKCIYLFIYIYMCENNDCNLKVELMYSAT